MTLLRSSVLVRLAVACLLSAVLVGLAVRPQLSARLTGETYELAVAPLDPIDPFRGAYVTLDYPGLQEARPTSWQGGEVPVFVPLQRDRRPACGPVVGRCARRPWPGRTCAATPGRAVCGAASRACSPRRTRRGGSSRTSSTARSPG